MVEGRKHGSTWSQCNHESTKYFFFLHGAFLHKRSSFVLLQPDTCQLVRRLVRERGKAGGHEPPLFPLPGKTTFLWAFKV